MNVRSTRVEPETTVWGRARSVAPRSTNPRQTSPKRPRSTTLNPRTRPHAPPDGVALTRRVALLVQHAAGGTAIAHAPNKRSKATLSTTHETFASGASNPLTRDNSGSHTLAFDVARSCIGPARLRPRTRGAWSEPFLSARMSDGAERRVGGGVAFASRGLDAPAIALATFGWSTSFWPALSFNHPFSDLYVRPSSRPVGRRWLR